MPVLQQYGVKRAVLFGSYAKGTADEKSDVDLLVDSGLKGFSFLALGADIEDSLKKEVDLLDVTHIVKNSRIDREIAATGMIIYER